MGSEFGFRDEPSSTENVLKTTRDLVAETPSALYNQLSDDMRNPGKLATTFGVSTAAGFGMTALLSKAPKVGGIVVAGVAGYEALRYGSHGLDFIGRAADANTDFQRKQLVDRYSKGLAREGATMIEATPGMLVGGSLAVKAVGMPNSYKAVGSLIERNTPQSIKNASAAGKEFVAEQWAFRGPGKMQLPSNILHTDGKVNVLDLGEFLAPKHPWQGVETGRSVDLLRQKISKPIIGKAESIDPGFADKPGRILFHTHGPESSIGTRPGQFDLVATQDLGIISRGNQRAYFVGQAREFNAAVKAGTAETFSPKLQTLILDTERKTAFTLESVWLPRLQSWQPAVPKFVDYQAAQNSLRSINITKPWEQIGELPVLPSIRGQNIDFSSLNWLKTGTIR